MTVNSLAALEKQLMDKLSEAMNEAGAQMWIDTDEEVKDFYSQGEPKYVRTGKLGSTPSSTPVSVSGKSVSFEIYLDSSRGYSTGSFSMSEVLTNAEAHTAGIVGKPGFWERSKKKMEATLTKVIGAAFR